MAKKQIDPDLVPQKKAPAAQPRATTRTAVPTPARMKAGRGISNGVKPGKTVGC